MTTWPVIQSITAHQAQACCLRGINPGFLGSTGADPISCLISIEFDFFAYSKYLSLTLPQDRSNQPGGTCMVWVFKSLKKSDGDCYWLIGSSDPRQTSYSRSNIQFGYMYSCHTKQKSVIIEYNHGALPSTFVSTSVNLKGQINNIHLERSAIGARVASSTISQFLKLDFRK